MHVENKPAWGQARLHLFCTTHICTSTSYGQKIWWGIKLGARLNPPKFLIHIEYTCMPTLNRQYPAIYMYMYVVSQSSGVGYDSLKVSISPSCNVLILILCQHAAGIDYNKLFTHNIVSSTKYLGGHTDLVGGAVSFVTEELGEQLKYHQILLGSCTVSASYHMQKWQEHAPSYD